MIPVGEFQRIMELLAERDIYIISDECYLRFVYSPAKVFSAASLPAELRERLCIAGSFPKTYSMTAQNVVRHFNGAIEGRREANQAVCGATQLSLAGGRE